MFDVFENTMSLHLRENIRPLVKHGRPGDWSLDPVSEDLLSRDELEELTREILLLAEEEDNSFVEDDQELVQVIQLKNYRIVITIPPFSDAFEITVVRPTIQRTIRDYRLNPRLLERLEDRAEGILIAGAPGHGKSTFAAAIANLYADKEKIVKTIEKPRDLQLDDRITQFTTLPEDVEKLGDVLLLMRPDYIIFDEIRKNLDFTVYTDLRLAGVGLVGVIHATKPIDAIQRFVTRIELGMIPSVIDTVIFIHEGEIDTVLSLKMTVKTPSGFRDDGLARPVIEVSDFENKTRLYELFSFGEQIVIIPIGGTDLYDQIRQKRRTKKKGKGKKKHKQNFYENSQGFEPQDTILDSIPSEIIATKKHLIVYVGEKYANEHVQLMIGPQVIMNAVVDETGEARLSRKKATTKRLERMLDEVDTPLSVRII